MRHDDDLAWPRAYARPNATTTSILRLDASPIWVRTVPACSLSSRLGWRLQSIPRLRAGETSKMTSYAEPDLRQNSSAETKEARTERYFKWARLFMMAAIVAMVVLAVIAEARMTPDERAALFETYANAYP
jgi:hypothetical protein